MVPTYLEDPYAAFSFNNLVRQAVDAKESILGALWVSPVPNTITQCERTLSTLPQPGIKALKAASNTWEQYGIDPASWTKAVRINVERILEAARHHDLVIHFHTGYLRGAQPSGFGSFMRQYGAAATYQLVHMGEAIGPVFEFVPRFLRWINEGYSVYTDTSLVPGFGPRWLLTEIDRCGVGLDRVLFATDAPWGSFEAEHAKIASLPICDSVRDRIFWANAADLYALPPSNV